MKKIYFASDFHLGLPNQEDSLVREKKIVAWLDSIKDSAEEIYLLGDLFDFWFEYKHAVPKGYVRLLGKLAELKDSGIPIHVFTGNHDLWMFGYFERELGIPVYKDSVVTKIHGKKFYMAHGDGLGPGDKGYKRLKKVFTNRFCQRLFAAVHPSIGIGIANYFSKKSRYENDIPQFLGEDREWLIQYAKRKLESEHYDYFVFGHRHIPVELQLKENCTFYNLGDWITHFSYAEFDGTQMQLKYYT